MNRKSYFRQCTVLLTTVLATCFSSYAAQVVYLDNAGVPSVTQHRVETAASFYGLESRVILLTGKSVDDNATATAAMRDQETVAVVVTAKALASLDQKQVFVALHRNGSQNLPLLIAGIAEQTPADLMRKWSGGAISNCTNAEIEKGDARYTIANVSEVVHQLGGSKLPLLEKVVRYLTLDGERGAQWIMAATSGDRQLPVFARANLGTQDVFFLTSSDPVEIPAGPDPYGETVVFSSLAPQLMFIRYAAGDRAWHSPGHYANLTIDDAWLRESYGYVNYQELLQEMERNNFHTTIAFIPWNYDRNQAAVVSLFREHPNRFSICIHGNNHHHQEFGAYDSRPLDGQISDIKQGLARMAKFSELTRLPYDPVMVFPHSIAPEKTLEELKRYNFSATVNFINVPLGASTPAEPEFALRPATMAFSSFPSLRRYSDEAPRPEAQLAIDAFLGNPMLFYVHQGFFAAGIGAFDDTAAAVNRIQPDTQWRSLGSIAQHLYLLKQRDDGNYDVRTYSGTLRLDNPSARDATFFIEKDEDFSLPLTVEVDGRPYPYEKAGAALRLRLPVRAGASREITIRYQNDLNLASIDISKKSMRLNAVRYLSDFRDNVVSRIALGRIFVRSYTQNEAAWNRNLILVAGLFAIGGFFWLVRRSKRRAMMSDGTTVAIGANHRASH